MLALLLLMALLSTGTYASAASTQAPWHELDAKAYRQARDSGSLATGVVFYPTPSPRKGSIVFVHGRRGAPSDFRALAAPLSETANLAAFVYDDAASLHASAEHLRRELSALPGETVVIAHSMGALLPAYIGATDPDGSFRHLALIAINPLVGGSRRADAPGLAWLRPLKPVLMWLLAPPYVRDVTPERAFQQTIFGAESAPSTFRERTVLVLSEDEEDAGSLEEERIRHFFGREKRELLDRTATRVVRTRKRGHTAPLRNPALIADLVRWVRDRP